MNTLTLQVGGLANPTKTRPVLRGTTSGRHLILMAAMLATVGGTASVDAAPKTKTVAVLIFEGVELLDFAGPAEVFIVASQRQPFRVVTVSKSTNIIKTMGGIKVKPEYTFQNAPAADVVVIPGGNTSSVGEEGIAWLKKSAGKAEVVMSVCFGAFLLAEADLLDGVTATTHRWAMAGLRRAAPRCKVVENKRYVDSGKIVTTGGVTAGIDGALHVVKRLAGPDVAQWTAESWMEHRWQRSADTPKSKSRN